MNSKTFGLQNIKRIHGDNDFACYLINPEIMIKYITNNIIIVPKFQRELDNCKIENIERYFKKEQRKNNNIFNYQNFAIAFYKIDKKNNYLLVDGQHRIEAIKKLLNENDYENKIKEIRVTIKNCEDYNDCCKYFTNININSDMEPIYKALQDPFNQKLIVDLKQNIKNLYFNGFSPYKNNNIYYHLDEFIDMFQQKKLLNTNFLDSNNQIIIEKILDKLKDFNIIIQKNTKDINQLYNKKTIYKLKKTNIYFSLKSVNLIDMFKGDNLIMEKNISNSDNFTEKLKRKVWNRSFSNINDGNCFCCDTQISFNDFECGYIIPQINGGKKILENLKPICECCKLCIGNQNMLHFKNNYYYYSDSEYESCSE